MFNSTVVLCLSVYYPCSKSDEPGALDMFGGASDSEPSDSDASDHGAPHSSAASPSASTAASKKDEDTGFLGGLFGFVDDEPAPTLKSKLQSQLPHQRKELFDCAVIPTRRAEKLLFCFISRDVIVSTV